MQILQLSYNEKAVTMANRPAGPANSEETILALPPSTVFDTHEQLYDFLQSVYRRNPATIIKRDSRGKDDFRNGNWPTRVVFVYDRGLSREVSTPSSFILTRMSQGEMDVGGQTKAAA